LIIFQPPGASSRACVPTPMARRNASGLTMTRMMIETRVNATPNTPPPAFHPLAFRRRGAGAFSGVGGAPGEPAGPLHRGRADGGQGRHPGLRRAGSRPGTRPGRQGRDAAMTGPRGSLGQTGPVREPGVSAEQRASPEAHELAAGRRARNCFCRRVVFTAEPGKVSAG